MSSVGRGRVQSRNRVSNLSKVGLGLTVASIIGIKMFVNSVQKIKKSIDKKIDDKLHKEIRNKQEVINQMDSELQAFSEKTKKEFQQSSKEIQTRMEKSKKGIDELSKEQNKIEDEFLDKFELSDKISDEKYNSKMNLLFKEYDITIQDYKKNMEEDNVLKLKKRIINEMIEEKIKYLSGHSDSGIKNKINLIKKNSTKKDQINIYQQLVNLEHELLLKSGDKNFQLISRKKTDIEDLFYSTIFHSEEIKFSLREKILRMNKKIVAKQYEQARLESENILNELMSIKQLKETSNYNEMETDFIKLKESVYENQSLFEEMKDDFIKLKMCLDGRDVENFRFLYENLLKKIYHGKGQLVADLVRQTMQEHKYQDIKITVDHNYKFKIRGYKDNKPLTFWMSKEGEFDFDFPEDALENDKQCHVEIKQILKELKAKLSKHEYSLNIFEVIRKHRLKDAAIEEIKIRKDDGTIILKTTGAKLKKKQKSVQRKRLRD